MVWDERRGDRRGQASDTRQPADIDYARVIHSASFRRLQGKTQILNLGDSDFYRTRLTHSLEVAQIAGGIVRQFQHQFPDHPAHPHLPDIARIQAIGCTHDLGHPPFGHGGEVALNYCMRDHGGFEGNGQTLRVLSRLERFPEGAGANLTRRTLLGVLKYPVPYREAANALVRPGLDAKATTLRIIDRKASKPPKCYMDSEADVVDWILAPLGAADRHAFCAYTRQEGRHHKPLHKSFDCSIMDLADDIGFGVHDLEDALALRLMDRDDFTTRVPRERCAAFLDTLRGRYSEEFGGDAYAAFVDRLFGEEGQRKLFIGRMVHYLIASCRIDTREAFQEPLIRYRAAMDDRARGFLDTLKQAVMDIVILSPAVQQLEFKGQKMVVSVFEAMASEPRAFLPREVHARYRQEGDSLRVICDHISGMTDNFLMKTYDRLFSPHMGSVFDQL
ncbi:anti-phage deoxyguanosine triphosphatase [Nitrospirillum sp. BR 11163]|uniref:anti-phage deoxyguanosine triphosphatase n=1 Tax=Nitrospirillum sp. BR 11163 TaxID=3104323 RepID=UPI002AFF5561|nr:anti-phage deoxyguanosine triphosphatase [Nitrospirillum sp. BR 11163]MEA1673602.1 anti-phage deoxyguanosine triphosphatase [Nitrospirillum sp. BR 11163]